MLRHKYDRRPISGACASWGLSLAATFILVCGYSADAPAQASNAQVSADSSAASDSSSIEEVVVTARRRSEALSNVPVAVSVVNASTLAEQHITSEQDLQTAVPGLMVYGGSSSNGLNFSLRGQSVDPFSFSYPAVLTYVNEFNTLGDSANPIFDISSVQVLKGPQGTLFGRNATGGAVLYQTQEPKPDFGGYALMDFGNYGEFKYEGALNLPMGALGELRIAGLREQRTGFQDNVLLGQREGSIDNTGVRLSWLFHPTDQLRSLTVASWERSGGFNTALKTDNVIVPGQVNNGTILNPSIPTALIYGPGVIVANPQVQRLGFNGIVDFLGKQGGYGFYDVFDAATNRHNGEDDLYTNTTTFVAADWITIKNIAGYHRAFAHDIPDLNGNPYQPLVNGFEPGTAASGYYLSDQQASEELQASGTVLQSKLDYIAGLYYFYGRSESTYGLNIVGDLLDPTTLQPIPPAAQLLRSFVYWDRSLAGYAQGTYAITDALHFTAGVRYTRDSVSYSPNDGDIEQILGVQPAEVRNSKPSWTDSLDFKITPEWMVYVANRGSWRAGGFNGTTQTTLPDDENVAQSYKPETTWDVEVGTKFNGRFLAMPTTLNVALYDQHVSNVIRTIYFGASALTGNVNKGEVKGVEADGSIAPADWLRLGFASAYTDAKYTDPIADVGGSTVIFGPYGDTPRFNGSVYARTSTKLPDRSEVVGRVDLYAQSYFYYSNTAATITPNTRIPGYSLINLRAEWNNIRDSKFSVAAFATNLADRHYFIGGLATGAITGLNSVLEGPPRMYGAELKYEF
jgi:iron complex outermembrane recepter protein